MNGFGWLWVTEGSVFGGRRAAEVVDGSVSTRLLPARHQQAHGARRWLELPGGCGTRTPTAFPADQAVPGSTHRLASVPGWPRGPAEGPLTGGGLLVPSRRSRSVRCARRHRHRHRQPTSCGTPSRGLTRTGPRRSMRVSSRNVSATPRRRRSLVAVLELELRPPRRPPLGWRTAPGLGVASRPPVGPDFH